jgi:hypothetical protein
MPVTVFKSSNPGAIQLDGQAGSLVAVLDSVLVAAGWSIAFTGTNVRAYRQPATADSALRAYLRVDDNGPGSGGGKEARIVGYETMIDVNTGTLPCPTVASFPNGLFVRKSNTANATTRPWLMVADARTFYMWVNTGDAADTYLCWMFGDFYSFVAADPYRVMVMGRVTENSSTVGSDIDRGDYLETDASVATEFCWVFRDVLANAGAIAAVKNGALSFSTSEALLGNIAYKNPADQYAYTPPVIIAHPANSMTRRGLWRGQYHFCHAISNVTDRETMPGREDLVGKTLMVVKQGGNGGVWLVETSSTWPTN